MTRVSVPLADVLTPSDNWVSIIPTATYREVTVRLWGKGVVERGIVAGSAMSGSSRLQVNSGEFILSKIDARNGALGLLPPTLDQAVVSSDFPVFRPDPDRLLPEYLGWVCRTPDFVDMCRKASEGTTNRVRLKIDRFLASSISLPPIEEQRRIVAYLDALSAKITEARTLHDQAAEETVALAGSISGEFLSGRWPQMKLEEVCPIITDGTHQTPRYTEQGAIFLSAQNVKPFRFKPEKHRKVSHDDFRSYTARNKPRRGDVLMTRVGAGIGEAAVIDQEIDFAIYVSLALIRTDSTRLSPEYLVQWLNSPAGRASSHRETLGRGNSQGNLNLKLLRAVTLPVPPLPEQRRIVAELDALQAKADTLKGLQTESAAELDALLPAALDRALKGEL